MNIIGQHLFDIKSYQLDHETEGRKITIDDINVNDISRKAMKKRAKLTRGKLMQGEEGPWEEWKNSDERSKLEAKFDNNLKQASTIRSFMLGADYLGGVFEETVHDAEVSE